jgi:hypothetical protein
LEERRGLHRVVAGKPEGKDNLGETGVDGRILLIKLTRFLLPSNTTLYYTENNQLGYMLRPCGGHHQASTM